MTETFVFLKPDAIERGLIGEIISRFEKKGFEIFRIEMIVATLEKLEKHYAEHYGKPFYQKLIDSLAHKTIICMIIRGPTEDTVQLVRQMVGEANPLKRVTGTIRGDFSCEQTKNLVHSSDSDNAARNEIALWFSA